MKDRLSHKTQRTPFLRLVLLISWSLHFELRVDYQGKLVVRLLESSETIHNGRPIPCVWEHLLILWVEDT
jgi:hypothetical protein